MKIVQALEYSNILLKEIAKTIQNERKKTKSMIFRNVERNVNRKRSIKGNPNCQNILS